MTQDDTTPRSLAAIDLDGTLLNRHARVSSANFAALEELASRGYEVVLASGRHPVDMARIAADLPMVRWLVSCQGGEVSDVARRRVLSHTGLPAGAAMRVAEAGRREGFAVIGYTADAEVAPWEDAAVRRYEHVSKTRVQILGESAFAAADLLKVMWIGSTERIDTLVANHRVGEIAAGLDTVRSHDYVFEFMPPGVSKATGVSCLTETLDIARERVVAFGDADNDVPLFRWAGWSIAMPHARAHVQREATTVSPDGPADSAFARAVQVLAESGFPAG